MNSKNKKTTSYVLFSISIVLLVLPFVLGPNQDPGGITRNILFGIILGVVGLGFYFAAQSEEKKQILKDISDKLSDENKK